MVVVDLSAVEGVVVVAAAAVTFHHSMQLKRVVLLVLKQNQCKTEQNVSKID